MPTALFHVDSDRCSRATVVESLVRMSDGKLFAHEFAVNFGK